MMKRSEDVNLFFALSKIYFPMLVTKLDRTHDIGACHGNCKHIM